MVAELASQESVPPAERELLSRLGRQFRRGGTRDAHLLIDGEQIPLPASLVRVLALWVRALERGQPVTILHDQKMLTTREAADVLNVPHPYLARLLERREIPFSRVGTHRRVLAADLLAYKKRRDAQRKTQLDHLAQMSQELGLYGDD